MSSYHTHIYTPYEAVYGPIIDQFYGYIGDGLIDIHKLICSLSEECLNDRRIIVCPNSFVLNAKDQPEHGNFLRIPVDFDTQRTFID